MSTTVLNIHEAKTHLSRHLTDLRPGDRIVLCRRNKPIAEILPLEQPDMTPRPIGLGRGLAVMKPDFFEPLPEELLELFEGNR